VGWEAEAGGECEEDVAVWVEGGEKGMYFVVVRLNTDDTNVGGRGDRIRGNAISLELVSGVCDC